MHTCFEIGFTDNLYVLDKNVSCYVFVLTALDNGLSTRVECKVEL